MPEEAIEKSQAPWKKKDWKTYVSKALKTGSALALVLAQLRRTKGASGWIAVGITAASFALDVATQWKEIMAPDIWDFFQNSEEWEVAPPLLRDVIVKNCENVESVVHQSPATIRRGTLGDFGVYWREHQDTLDYGPFFKNGDRDGALQALGDMLWNQVGSKNVVLSKQGTLEPSDEELEDEPVMHESMTKLRRRVQRFMEEGENRSYLLEGPPGSGKTTAIRHIIHELGLRSLRLNFDDAVGNGNRWDGKSTSFNTSSLIKMMRPDVLVIDDFERNFMNDRDLLHLMEVAHQHCRVVLATVNNKELLTGAMKRVGRFDDHVVIDKIPLEVVKTMLDPELHEFARKAASWPIAYIGDFNKRKRVLGLETAREEFASLHHRATGGDAPKEEKKTSSPVKVGKKVSKKKKTTKKVARTKPTKTKYSVS